MDPEVQRLVIGQLLGIVVPVGILWYVWIKMLDQWLASFYKASNDQ